MGEGKIQWHPGFVAVVDLELAADRGHLVYEKEYNLNRKPLQIDLLVLKKDRGLRLENEIGRLFRKYNLMEYKSPQGHVWLKALSDQMTPDSLRDFWEQIQGISGKYDRELADAVLEVCTRANWETIRELRGGGKEMCQAMLELMEPEINQIRKETAEKAAAEATRKAEEAAAEAIKKATQKVEKIEKSARREAVHTVKSLLKSGKLSAEEIAGCVPRLSLDEIRAIAAGIARA